MTGEQLAQAARRLTGIPFRLHGRDPRLGLDCIGVLSAAFAASSRTAALPNGYALRRRSLPEVGAIAASLGLEVATGPVQPGDVLLLRPSPVQVHLAIAASPQSIIHAHAGLRKVVVGPLPREWPVVGRWRIPSSRI